MNEKVEDAAEKSEKRAALALQLKEGLLRLGPTFIKLGQLLSTRWVYGSILSDLGVFEPFMVSQKSRPMLVST